MAGPAGRGFASTAAARLGTAAVGIMVARLLGPHEFGTYVVAYVALQVLVNVNDLGVGLAIPAWPGDPREAAPTAATLSLGTSVLIYAGCYLGAPGYAAAMGAPAAAGVVRVLCLAVVADGLVSSPAGLLQRCGRHDRRLIAGQASVWLGALLTGALAVAGLGAMSLAVGRLAGCLAALVALVAFSPEPLRFGFRPAAARALLRSGLPLAGQAVVTLAVIGTAPLVIGPVLGVTALGYFVLASNLSGWPVTLSTQPVRDAAPVLFARLRHEPAAVRRAFVTVAGLTGAIALPVCLAISGLAVPLAGFVYGQRWLPAAPALAWLAGLAALQLAFEFGWGYLAVLARTRVVLTLQFVWLAVLIPALAAGAMTGGIAGTARAEVAVAAGLALPWYLWALRRTGISGRVLAGRLALPVAGAAVTGLTCVAASVLVPGWLPALAAGGTVTVLVIGLLLYHLRGDLVVLLRGPRERAARDAAAGAWAAGGWVAGPEPVPAGAAGVAGPAGSAARVPPPGLALAGRGPAADRSGAAEDPGPGWARAGGGREPGWAGVPEDGEGEWAAAREDREPQWAAASEGREAGWAAAPEGREPEWAAVPEGREPEWAAAPEGREAGWAAAPGGGEAGWAGAPGEWQPEWAGPAEAWEPHCVGGTAGRDPGRAGGQAGRDPGRAGGQAGRDPGRARGQAGRDHGSAGGQVGRDSGRVGGTAGQDPYWAGKETGQGWADAADDPDPGWAGVPEDWDRDWARAAGDGGRGWPGEAGDGGRGWPGEAGDGGRGWPGEAGDPGSSWAEAAGQQVLPVTWPGLAARADATGPLPVFRAVPGMDVPLPRAAPAMGPPLDRALPPLYRATARALGWEPRAAPAPGHPAEGGRAAGGRAGPGGWCASGREEDWLPADWHPDRW